MNKRLRNKLLRLMKADQTMRRAGPWDKRVDTGNQRELNKIIRAHGWPDVKLVGKQGTTAAWLIAQHADHNVRFQEYCLHLLVAKADQRLAPPAHVAFLTDRVRVNRGQPQIYGTQFYANRAGEFTYRPVTHKDKLTARRRQVGLGPWHNYAKKMRMVQYLRSHKEKQRVPTVV